MSDAKGSTASMEGKETLPDQLKKAFQAGTEARKGLKSFAEKAKLISTWVIGVLLLIGMISIFIPYIKEEVPKVASATTQRGVMSHQAQSSQVAEASWKRNESGALPVGVWSEEVTIPFGCGTNFAAGNGSLYKVEYRALTPEWREHVPGQFPQASHLRFMVMEGGKNIATVPFSWNCPGR